MRVNLSAVGMGSGARDGLRYVWAAAVWLLFVACGDQRARPVENETPDKRIPTPEAPAPKTPAETGFSLGSRPSGASVIVDGKPRGTTPMQVDDLSPGNHNIRLELAGYAVWEAQFQVTAGVVMELPIAQLESLAEVADRVARTARNTPPEWYESAAEVRPQPLPTWPKGRGLPRDLQVIVTEYEREIMLAARSDGSGLVTVQDGWLPMLACSFAVDRAALGRFGWSDFVEVMEADRPRPQKCCSQSNQECCTRFSVSIRAFGRTLMVQEVAQHYLDYDLRDRVESVIEGLYLPQSEPIDTALSDLADALSRCVAENAPERPRRLPPHFPTTVPNGSGGFRMVSTGDHVPAPFTVALPRNHGRARLVATAKRFRPRELACARKAIAAATFPGSTTCQLSAEAL